MDDFVSVAADYMERDGAGVIFTSIRALEECGCFRWPMPVPNQNASSDEIRAFANVLRRRPAENIERLLAVATGSQRILATRVRYLINRLFALLEWNVDDTELRRFLAAQFARRDASHALITFNYDLFLDRAVQEMVPSWSIANGYGITISGCIHDDPDAEPPGPNVLSVIAPASDANIVILKPHGSLNWLVPLADELPMGEIGLLFADHPPVVPLRHDGRLRYCKATSNFQYLYPVNDNPMDVLPAIIPPVKKKNAGLPLFVELQSAERTALEGADEIFIIGWSMPSTDSNQVDLIVEAVAKRRTPLQQVTIVNRGEDPSYFSRLADIFGVPSSSLRIFNDGFADFVAATAQTRGVASIKLPEAE